jgi:hypothetical protein
VTVRPRRGINTAWALVRLRDVLKSRLIVASLAPRKNRWIAMYSTVGHFGP